MPSPSSVSKIEELDCYLVGGAVRDRLLGIDDDSERDWVVVGATPEIMHSLGFKEIGKDFPVFLHPVSREEYALARTERKSGRGYKGFVVDISSDVTLEQDLYRRDLTVNSMALAADDTLIDPYGGKSDLENGVLRHVSDNFVEDPLRVLRVARFAARFFSKGFIVDESTIALMQRIAETGELHDLVAERVWQEVRTALGENNPSIFFKVLHICGALKQLFPELEKLHESSDSSGTCHALDALDLAAGISENVDHRFAVVVYLIGKHLHAKSTLDGHQGDQDAATTVRELCERLKVSATLKNLSAQIVRYADQVHRVNDLSADEIVDMIRALNGLRDQSQFESFLDVCTTVLRTQSDRIDEIESAVDRLKSFRNRMVKVDAQALSKIYSSDKLRDQVRLAQIAAVEQVR